MAVSLRELITKIGFQVDEKGADDAEKKVKKMSLGMKTAIGAVVTGIFAIGAMALNAAGDMEMLTTQFEVMLGSTEAAVTMMDELKTFAASTPFALEDLATGTQQLLSFGVAEGDVIDAMKLLGDTAGGNAEKLNGLVLAYGKVQAKGKASMEEINMLTERGVPIISTLREQLGVTEDAFFKLVSAGKIGRDDITQAFRTMTSEGGMFFEGMKKQSLTFQGLVSTMKDNIKLMLASIGETLLPVAKQIVETITNLVQGPLGDLVASLVGSLAPVIESLAGLLENVVRAIAPLSKILAAIMPLIITILGLFDSLAPILDIVTFILEGLASILDILLVPLNDMIASIVEIINLFVEMISLQLMSLLEPLMLILIDVAKIIGDIFTALMPIINIMIKLVAFKIGVQIKSILIPLTLLLKVLAPIFRLLSKIINAITSKLLPVMKFFERAIDILIAIVTHLAAVFAKFVEDGILGLVEFAKMMGTLLFERIGRELNTIKFWLTSLRDFVKDIIMFISNILSQFWGWLFDRFPALGELVNAIGNVFINMWDTVKNVFLGMWDAVVSGIQKVIGWIKKIPGVDIDIPDLDGGDGNIGGTSGMLDGVLKASANPEFNPAITSAGKTANIDMQNNITVAVPPGSNTEAIKGAVEAAARAVFTVELQKLIVDTGI